MNENQIERKIEKYRAELMEKHESDVADKLFEWIGDQDERPSQEAIDEKQEQLEAELTEWIDGQVKEYDEGLTAEDASIMDFSDKQSEKIKNRVLTLGAVEAMTMTAQDIQRAIYYLSETGLRADEAIASQLNDNEMVRFAYYIELNGKNLLTIAKFVRKRVNMDAVTEEKTVIDQIAEDYRKSHGTIADLIIKAMVDKM